MKIVSSAVIYENPLPQLRSRQSAFPFLAEMKNSDIAAIHVIGEAFESVDGASYISISHDGGKSFGEPRRIFAKDAFGRPVSECCKATVLADGRLVALGYAFYRDDPDLPVGNPQTGGLLDDVVFFSISEDNGESFSAPTPIPCAWGPHVEASGPITVTKEGAWLAPITGFPGWDGVMTGALCGRALISRDEGRTWSDDAVCMDFGGAPVTCYEQRACTLASGTLINIGWNENTQTGERMHNHFTASFDGGATWTAPADTGMGGQASSVCALGGERFLALFAVRRDTDRPGIYAAIVDFSDRTWRVVDEAVLWEPPFPISKDTNMAEIFSFLKFGQPGAILLSDGDVLMSHWYADQGQYKTVATRISL